MNDLNQTELGHMIKKKTLNINYGMFKKRIIT